MNDLDSEGLRVSEPPRQDDIDELRRWALDVIQAEVMCRDVPRRILRVCNGISNLRAEVARLKANLKRLSLAYEDAKWIAATGKGEGSVTP